MDKQRYIVDDNLVEMSSREDSFTIDTPTQDDADDQCLSRRATRDLLNKIDLHLLPLISVLYLVSCLDRSNLGNAEQAGLADDLHMTGKDDYNVSCWFPLQPFPASFCQRISRSESHSPCFFQFLPT